MKFIPYYLVIVLATISFSCSKGLYNHYTHTETIEAKIQANSLVKLSVTPYSNNVDKIIEFKNHLQKMLAYEKTKNKNSITIKMWEFVNSENNSIYKFLKVWESQEVLSPSFTTEFEKDISNIFDVMIDYETKKDKPSQTALINLINAI